MDTSPAKVINDNKECLLNDKKNEIKWQFNKIQEVKDTFELNQSKFLFQIDIYLLYYYLKFKNN